LNEYQQLIGIKKKLTTTDKTMIKKIAAVCAFVLGASAFCMAQTSMGTWSVGGGMYFSGSKSHGDDVKNTSYSFAPAVGYFVADNFMVGAELSMNISRQDNGNTIYRQTSFGIGPFLRYYKFTKNEQFAFFGDFGFAYASGRDKQDDNDPTKSRGFNMYLSPGFTWFPTSHWGVDFQVSLLSFTSHDPDIDRDDDKSNYFNFGLNTFAPSLAIRYFIGK
jgi:hypothetical protein